ncbi:MAG: hypothetical protein Q9166_007396 [cf. Caloplaca sp. 2 TL-2023]
MPVGRSSTWHVTHAKTSLTALFVAWKIVLVLIACTSPYPGYDTSTTLLTTYVAQQPSDQHVVGRYLQALAQKLTRWDAIYFTQIAHRGALLEQEWAFGWGYSKLLNRSSQILFDDNAGLIESAVAGIFVSNIAHLLSIFTLYQISKTLIEPPMSDRNLSFAFLSACLHIISPAGLFLSAPYAESSFSFLNFVGFYLYASNLQAHRESYPNLRDASVLLSGLSFGLATTFRSNGLLSGLLFCFDIAQSITALRSDVQAGKIGSNLRRVLFLVIAGILMAIGSCFPQYLAYREYCIDAKLEHRALWCTHRIPSIYSWVQSHYW